MVIAVLSPDRTIFWFVIFGWSGISASFCPMMILSLSWKRYNEKGAIASMISGFLGVPFFKFVAPSIAVVGPYLEPLSELPERSSNFGNVENLLFIEHQKLKLKQYSSKILKILNLKSQKEFSFFNVKKEKIQSLDLVLYKRCKILEKKLLKKSEIYFR